MLLGSLISAQALTCLPGTGTTISIEQTRDTEARYHNDQDDYHLYGTHQWAVRFNFQNFYSAVPNCRFITHGARIFFPNAASSATVSLFADADSLPTGNPLRQVSSTITSTHMDFQFPDTLSASVIWLVVDYNTNGITTFVSASRGGGNHSYYLNTNPTNPFLQSMSEAGFHCELAFGLIGTFSLNSPDLQLISFGLEGDIVPRQAVKPIFNIYNHSASPATNLAIHLECTSPRSEYTLVDTIFITESVPSQDSLVVVAPGYQDYVYTLPETPMQMKVKATLVSDLAESEAVLPNNIITSYYQVFNQEFPFFLAEDFTRTSTVESFLTLQDNIVPANYRTLLYFPNLADSLSNLGALDRFQWYGYNAFPSTAIQGSRSIYGFPSDYSTRLQQAISSSLTQHTFFGHVSKRIIDLANTDDLQLEVSMNNDETSLYDSPSLNPVLQSRFFAGLFKKIPLADSPRPVLSKWIAFADTVNSPLLQGTTLAKSYTFSHPNLTGADLVRDYCIFFWLQNISTGQIIYADSTNFVPSMFTGVSDDYTPQPELHLYPNPLRAGNDLKISGLESPSQVKIYNLRGQLVWQNDTREKSLNIPTQVFPTSGIYFLTAESTTGSRHLTIKKISYIK